MGARGRVRLGALSGVTIGLVETAEVPQEVLRLRHEFADRIVAMDETAWDEASWCSGWQVRDVLAHLVRNAESTPWSLMSDLLRGGFRPDHSVNIAAKRLSGVPVRELADRLRSAADERLRSAAPRNHSAWATLSCTVQTHFGHLARTSTCAPTLRRPCWTLIGTGRGWSSMQPLTGGTAWWRRTLTGPGEVEQR